MVRHAQRLWRFLILAHAILQEENQLHWSRFRNPFLWTKQKVFGASIASNLFFPRVESCLILQKKETHRVHHGCFGRPRSDYHNFPQRLIDLANIVPPWTSKTRISKNACHPLKTNGWKPPKMEDWKDMLFLSKTDEQTAKVWQRSINGNEKPSSRRWFRFFVFNCLLGEIVKFGRILVIVLFHQQVDLLPYVIHDHAASLGKREFPTPNKSLGCWRGFWCLFCGSKWSEVRKFKK